MAGIFFRPWLLSANVSIQGGKDEIFIGNGSVLIPEIPSGNYNFRISAEGYDDGFLNDINVVPNQNLWFVINDWWKSGYFLHFKISFG